MKRTLILVLLLFPALACAESVAADRPRVIVTTDGEIDDECSMVRFLLYANEFDIEGIITSSSQYHWQGHNWAGDDWMQPYLDAYARVYPNLTKHDRRYPKPELLRARTLLGNVKEQGEMEDVTAGSQRIVESLLDESDPRPVWIQAWGGRFVKVRENTWLDPVTEPGYQYPAGRWYGNSAWGRQRLKKGIRNDAELIAYLKPQWRWIGPMQNDFAARADWCVREFTEANHHPFVEVDGELTREVTPGETVRLAAAATDPDGDDLAFRWWQYSEADSAAATVTITDSNTLERASFVAPNEPGKNLHLVLEVTDNGTPPLTRYQRIICEIE